MKVVDEYPPNYKEICQAISGVQSKEGVVFTYGDTIYNPYNGEIQDHLDVHETVHKSQQMQIGVEEWWNKYLESSEFRLKQEISAYRAQYKFVYKHYGWQAASKFLPEIARDLSGEMYGNILTYEQARNEITRK